MSNNSRATRDRLVDALRRELMGPTSLDEVIREYPTSRYLVGRIAPARAADDDMDAEFDPAENDSLAAGESSDEDGGDESSVPLVIGFNPSSFGLSFLVDASARTIRAKVSWGDYKRERKEREKESNESNKESGGATVTGWRRYHREGVVEGIKIGSTGAIPRILLSPSAQNASGIVVSGVDDPEVALEGVVHDFAGYRALSLFVVNRRTKGALGDRSKDERWMFQPRLRVEDGDDKPIFVAKDFLTDPLLSDDDGEVATGALLYRHAREFATGHGVAADWDPPIEGGRRTISVSTEFMPKHEVPLLIAPSELTGGATLDMKALAETTSPQALAAHLEPMVRAYEDWIQATETASHVQDIQNDPQLRDAATVNINRCKECAARMRAGLTLLQRDAHVCAAFRFANRAMWDQRVHSLWAAENRKRGAVHGAVSDFDKAGNRTWRPFQMGFILLNLRGIADDGSEDRRLIELLWFPTGGGKTEAYLGLSAFTLALRRLRGDRHGMHAGAGVSIIMRYTLRLLTVQQFQRAAALICACELIRRSEPNVWGNEPFRIGIWVGRGTTPNTFSDSQKALEELGNGKRPRSASPVQLVACPRCGTTLVDEKGVPESNTYQPDNTAQRTLVWCRNDDCEFSPLPSSNQGIPVVVVDDEIYRTCPSIVVATVDKFARIPFKGQTRALFGLRNRYSPTYGHITEADGDSIPGRKLRDASPAPRLLPPELIIQDELHLISGPLGTMVGLYETVVEYASSIEIKGGPRIPPKVIASTATIRRAAQQTRQLYGGRKLGVAPLLRTDFLSG